ncbi:MAG: bifunctional adenosylcobinamide kinase/adenosylcobinamide-phosphate guanylyltransferase [Clostridia bacterium]
MSLIVITGGVRSGKSRIGEQQAASSPQVLYIATGQASDEEMANRIKLHQDRREAHWRTLEEPDSLLATVAHFRPDETVLVDSLTTWVSNQLIRVPEEQIRDQAVTQQIMQELDQWLQEIARKQQRVIVITDEVGLGGIAMSRLGRWFQDVLGEANQRLAAAADEVYAVFSGIAVRIKG